MSRRRYVPGDASDSLDTESVNFLICKYLRQGRPSLQTACAEADLHASQIATVGGESIDEVFNGVIANKCMAR